MWTRWTFKLFVPLACVPLVSAAVLAGCTQKVSDSQKQDERSALDHAVDQQRQNLRLKVTGCLSPGIGNRRFILMDAEPAPVPEQPSDALTAANITLPDRTAIRLAGYDEDKLAKLTGQEVTVTGILRHDGRDTIGTSGRAGRTEPEPRTDYSEAAATGRHYADKVKREAGPIGLQSMNNSTFPEMLVTEVKSAGKKCVTQPVQERR